MNAILVRGLRKSFGSHQAVRDASFDVEHGEVFGILGPNGAGKSTAVECIGGMTRPDGGSIRVLGTDPHANPMRVRRTLGYQMQSTTLPAQLKVREALRLFAALYPDPRGEGDLLEAVGAPGCRRSRVRSALRRAETATLDRADADRPPRVIILDEITTGLDPEGRRDVWALIEDIRSGGVTVLLVSHAIDEVQRLCDRIAVMVEGRSIYTGTPAQLIRDTLPRPHGSGTHSLEDAYLTLVAEHRSGDIDG